MLFLYRYRIRVELNASNQSNSVEVKLTSFIENYNLAGSPCIGELMKSSSYVAQQLVLSEIFRYPICKQSVGDIFLFLT